MQADSEMITVPHCSLVVIAPFANVGSSIPGGAGAGGRTGASLRGASVF